MFLHFDENEVNGLKNIFFITICAFKEVRVMVGYNKK